MSKKALVAAGLLGLAASALWMVLAQSSTGPFLLLAGVGGGLVVGGLTGGKDKSETEAAASLTESFRDWFSRR